MLRVLILDVVAPPSAPLARARSVLRLPYIPTGRGISILKRKKDSISREVSAPINHPFPAVPRPFGFRTRKLPRARSPHWRA